MTVGILGEFRYWLRKSDERLAGPQQRAQRRRSSLSSKRLAVFDVQEIKINNNGHNYFKLQLKDKVESKKIAEVLRGKKIKFRAFNRKEKTQAREVLDKNNETVFRQPIYIPFTTNAVMFLINSTTNNEERTDMNIQAGDNFIESIKSSGIIDYADEETTQLPLITHPTNPKSIINLIYGDKNSLRGPVKRGGSKQTRKKPKHKKHNTRRKNRIAETSKNRTRRKKSKANANKTRSATNN